MFTASRVQRLAKAVGSKNIAHPFAIRKVPDEVREQAQKAISTIMSNPKLQTPEVMDKIYKFHQRAASTHINNSEELFDRTRAALEAQIRGTISVSNADVTDPSSEGKIDFKYLSPFAMEYLKENNPIRYNQVIEETKNLLAKYPTLTQAVEERNKLVSDAYNNFLKSEIRASMEKANQEESEIGLVHRSNFSFIHVSDYLKSSASNHTNFTNRLYYTRFAENEEVLEFPNPSGLALFFDGNPKPRALVKDTKVGLFVFALTLFLMGCHVLRHKEKDITVELLKSLPEVERKEHEFAFSFGRRYSDVE